MLSSVVQCSRRIQSIFSHKFNKCIFLTIKSASMHSNGNISANLLFSMPKNALLFAIIVIVMCFGIAVLTPYRLKNYLAFYLKISPWLFLSIIYSILWFCFLIFCSILTFVPCFMFAKKESKSQSERVRVSASIIYSVWIYLRIVGLLTSIYRYTHTHIARNERSQFTIIVIPIVIQSMKMYSTLFTHFPLHHSLFIRNSMYLLLLSLFLVIRCLPSSFNSCLRINKVANWSACVICVHDWIEMHYFHYTPFAHIQCESKFFFLSPNPIKYSQSDQNLCLRLRGEYVFRLAFD